MGCICSSSSPIGSEHGNEPRRLCDTLGLSTKARKRLIQIYNSEDVAQNGGRGQSIDIGILLGELNIQCTTFVRRTLGYLQFGFERKQVRVPKEVRLDFYELVCSYWNFCSLTKSQLTRFVFYIFDLDSNGSLNVDEMYRMVDEIYDSRASASSYAVKALEAIDNLKKKPKPLCDSINLAGFELFCKACPALLFPIFQIQGIMQDAVVSEKYWRETVVPSRDAVAFALGYRDSHSEEFYLWLQSRASDAKCGPPWVCTCSVHNDWTAVRCTSCSTLRPKWTTYEEKFPAKAKEHDQISNTQRVPRRRLACTAGAMSYAEMQQENGKEVRKMILGGEDDIAWRELREEYPNSQIAQQNAFAQHGIKRKDDLPRSNGRVLTYEKYQEHFPYD